MSHIRYLNLLLCMFQINYFVLLPLVIYLNDKTLKKDSDT